MIGRKQEVQPQPEQQYTKEEYAAMKQAEREDAWAKVDAQAQEAFKDDASMKGFLNFMAQCTPQSTRNLLILYEQNKEITHPRTFDKWKEAGRSIRSGEKGYTFFADQEYTKEDGSRASGYTITKAYDISQTRGPQPLPPQKHLPEEIIAAMVEQGPVQLAISDQLPQGVQAQYVPKQRTIFVRNGMDETATICAIAREQAHASFDAVGSGYYRQAYAAQAYCAAYVAAQKFGLDTSVFQFDKVCHSCAQLTPDDKRGFIGDVKRAAYSINRDVQRSFRDLEQAIQPDEFSVAAPKPAKAEKEPER
ncbi:MAG: ArdC family protein [Hydrogeniiclostridium mannosilyticum]